MEKKSSRKTAYLPIIMPACIGLGTGFGALIHNIGIGMTFGVALGTILSLIAYYLVKPESS